MLIDVASGEVVVPGLSMPHSPRWHDGRLWILESGEGTLAVVDLDTGAVETVADLPGLHPRARLRRPLRVRRAVAGARARLRRHPAHRATSTQRVCGVWVVDTRTGEIVGFLRFEGAVQEIFDVQLLAGRRWPEMVEPGAELVSGSFVLVVRGAGPDLSRDVGDQPVKSGSAPAGWAAGGSAGGGGSSTWVS